MPVKPPFGTLNATLAKTIAANSPKGYRRMVEPFGDGGTMALYLAKRRPKEHVINIVAEDLFAALAFVQGASGADLAALKKRDWVASQETFDAAMAITATEGGDFFYKFLYIKKFGMQMTPEEPPVFDVLSTGTDGSKHLLGLPLMRVGLKGVEIVNGDPMAQFGGGGDAFTIILPKKPEEIEAAKSRLGGLGGPFFYAAKAADSQEIIDTAGQMKTLNVTAVTAASIMMSDFLTIWNYDGKLVPILETLGESAGEMAAMRSLNGGLRQKSPVGAGDTRIKAWLKAHERAERLLFRVAVEYFTRQRKDVQKRLRKLLRAHSGTLVAVPVDQVLREVFDAGEWDGKIWPAFESTIHTLMLEGAAREWATRSKQALPVGDLPANVQAAIQAELETIRDRPYWQDMNATTRRRLADTIEAGIRAGESEYELIVRIGDSPTVPGVTDGVLGSASNTVRAANIARTEGTMALNAGHWESQEELLQEGLIQAREWNATLDQYVRPAHLALHGVIAPSPTNPDGLFDVGGHRAPYPGHAGLPVEQRARCRCVVISRF